MKRKAVLALIALGAAAIGFGPGSSIAAPTYYLTTGQSNAQTQIDINHSSTWLITTGSSGFDLGGGNFEMKYGTATVGSIGLDLYAGADSTTKPVASILFTTSEFCGAHADPHCQSYAITQFHFDTPYALSGNSTYFAALTSNAGTPGSQQYFIKGANSSKILDGNGNPPLVGSIAATVTSIPEPGTLAILGFGFAGLTAWRLRRN